MLSQILSYIIKSILALTGLVLIWSAIDSFNNFAAKASNLPALQSLNEAWVTSSSFPTPSVIPHLMRDPVPYNLLLMTPKATITFNNFTIAAEVANTFWSRARGLSGRKNLAENEGLIFTYSKPQMTYYWMKDMNFPIDIVWLKKISDTQAQVLGIEANLPPLKKFAFVYYYPPEPVDLVLEINAGLSNTIGLSSGEVVDFSLSR